MCAMPQVLLCCMWNSYCKNNVSRTQTQSFYIYSITGWSHDHFVYCKGQKKSNAIKTHPVTSHNHLIQPSNQYPTCQSIDVSSALSACMECKIRAINAILLFASCLACVHRGDRANMETANRATSSGLTLCFTETAILQRSICWL